MIHLLVTPAELDSGAVVVEGDAYHHLFRVRRARKGEPVKAVDGHSRARFGVIETVDHRQALVTLEAEAPANEPRYDLQLWVAVVRPERASFVVEKGTELGVCSFHWFVSEHSSSRWQQRHLDRLRRVAVAALEQCGRARLPAIHPPCSFVEMLERLPASSALLDLEGTDTTSDRLNSLQEGAAGGIGVVVGPEGGFSAVERTDLLQRCTALSLGQRVLRVETAAVGGCAIVLSELDAG